MIEAYAKAHNMRADSLTVRLSQHRARVAKRLMEQAKATRQVYTNTADAERMVDSSEELVKQADALMKRLLDTAVAPEPGADTPWVDLAFREDARKAADAIYKRLGLNAPTANVQVNIANVIKTHPPTEWVKDEWKAVFAAMTKNEVAKNEVREFARQWWGWRIEER